MSALRSRKAVRTLVCETGILLPIGAAKLAIKIMKLCSLTLDPC